MEIVVYQINPDRDFEECEFMDYAYAEQHGIEPYAYDRVYAGELPAKNLEEAYMLLNTGQFPDGYRGRSLSKSDVCEVITDGQSQFFYCDTVGFKQIDFNPSQTQEPKEAEITVVALYPGKTAQITTLRNELSDLQAAVGGGLIQAVYPFNDSACVLCNDDGKYLGFEPNRALRTQDGQIYDILVGNAYICGLNGENFGSLTEDQQQKYMQQFKHPELFFKIGDEIKAIRVPEQQKEDRTQKHHRHR